MCKLFFSHCKACFTKHIIKEPEYCATVEKTLTKKVPTNKRGGRPVWIPTMSLARTDLGPFDIVTGDGRLRYISDEHYHPVDCERIQYVEEDSEDDCPFPDENEVRMYISERLMASRWEKENRKREADRSKAVVWHQVKLLFRELIA